VDLSVPACIDRGSLAIQILRHPVEREQRSFHFGAWNPGFGPTALPPARSDGPTQYERFVMSPFVPAARAAAAYSIAHDRVPKGGTTNQPSTISQGSCYNRLKPDHDNKS